MAWVKDTVEGAKCIGVVVGVPTAVCLTALFVMEVALPAIGQKGTTIVQDLFHQPSSAPERSGP